MLKDEQAEVDLEDTIGHTDYLAALKILQNDKICGCDVLPAEALNAGSYLFKVRLKGKMKRRYLTMASCSVTSHIPNL